VTDWEVKPLDGTLGQYATDWEALNQRLFGSNALLGSNFTDLLLAHFSSGKQYLCILREHGLISGMCILMPRRPGVWTTFLPSQAQIGPTLLPDAAHLGSLFNALPGFVVQLDMLCNDAAFGDLSSGASAPSVAIDHALTMNIQLQGSFDTYWESRSKQLRKNFRRWEKRLADDGIRPEFRIIEHPAEVTSAVERYGALEARGWKGRIGTALDADTQQSFYAKLLARCAVRGDATVFEMWFGDVLAASRLMIASPRMVVILKTTYDESLQPYAPGRLLLRQVIHHGFENWHGKSLEFYTNATADQLSWATGRRSIRHVTHYRNAWIAGAAARVRDIRSKHRKEEAGDVLACEAYPNADSLPEDVLSLFADAERQSIDLGAAWYRNYVGTVAGSEPCVRFHVLRRGGRAVAVLPVAVRPSRMPWHRKVASLSNFYSALYAPVLDASVDAAQLAMLVRAIRKAHAPVASWQFEPMDPTSAAYHTLRSALHLGGLRVNESFCFGNWYLPVDMNWNDYLAARPGEVRSTVRRMQRKLAHEGGHVEVVRDASDLARGVAAYQHVYSASWKRQEPFPDFMPGLMETCARRGWLRLGIVWLHGQAIAAQLWIVAYGKAAIYKLAYDAAFKAYSPGTVLTAHLMQEVLGDEQVREIDYLMGDDPYKKHWMTHRRERWRIVAYDSRTVGGLLGWARDAASDALAPLRARTR